MFVPSLLSIQYRPYVQHTGVESVFLTDSFMLPHQDHVIDKTRNEYFMWKDGKKLKISFRSFMFLKIILIHNIEVHSNFALKLGTFDIHISLKALFKTFTFCTKNKLDLYQYLFNPLKWNLQELVINLFEVMLKRLIAKFRASRAIMLIRGCIVYRSSN